LKVDLPGLYPVAAIKPIPSPTDTPLRYAAKTLSAVIVKTAAVWGQVA
jgi:hypothetical protein